MPYRPTSLSARQLAEAAAAGRDNAVEEREIAELTRRESAEINGGETVIGGTIGGVFIGLVLS